MRKVMPSELVLNQPLSWSIYDGHGNLLLKAGHVLSIPKHVNNLLIRGAFTEAPPPKRGPQFADPHETRAADPVTAIPTNAPPKFHPLSIFARMDSLAMTLVRLHAHLMAQSLKADLRIVVRSLAHAIMEAGTDNADALLIACHLDRHHAYLVVQQMLSTALTDLIAREMAMDDATRLSLVCAALTRDIALLPVQLQLDQQKTPLDSEQIARVRGHPDRTAEILISMGVDDPLWLEFVRQHHERLNGSGYPAALQADAILPGSRILAVTDSYAAMVTPRPNRIGQLPKDALKALQAQHTSLYDATILQRAHQVLTDFPPGTLMRLANGEIGVMRSRKHFNGQADLWLIYNHLGVPLMRPKRCDSSDPAYAISEILRIEECRSADLVMKRLWSHT